MQERKDIDSEISGRSAQISVDASLVYLARALISISIPRHVVFELPCTVVGRARQKRIKHLHPADQYRSARLTHVLPACL